MTIKDKIEKLVNELGISTEIQAKAMGITIQTLYNKRNENVEGHSFNKKNYKNLVEYVKLKASEL